MALIPFPLYNRLIQLLDEDEVDQLYELNPVAEADVVDDDEADNLDTLLESVQGPKPKMVHKSTMTEPQTSHDIQDPLEGTSTMYNHMFTPKQKPPVSDSDSEPCQKPQDPLEDKPLVLDSEPRQKPLEGIKPLVLDLESKLWDDDSDSEPIQRVEQQKQKPPRKVKFACTKCSSHFYTHAALSRHMLREHHIDVSQPPHQPPSPRQDESAEQSQDEDESTKQRQDESTEQHQDESTEQPQDESAEQSQDESAEQPQDEPAEQPLDEEEQAGRKFAQRKRKFDEESEEPLSASQDEEEQAGRKFAQRKRKFDEDEPLLVESKKGRPKSNLQLQCDYCTSTYKTKGGLLRHVLNIHGLDLKDEDWMMDTELPRNKRRQTIQGGKITKKLKKLGRKRKSDQEVDEPAKKRGKPQKVAFSIWKPRK